MTTMMECPICMDALSLYDSRKETTEDGYDIVGELVPCHHKFHSDCIRQWHSFAPDLKCPVCRTLSISMTIVYDSNTGYERKIQVDLKKGFMVDAVLQYEGVISPTENIWSSSDPREDEEQLLTPSEHQTDSGLSNEFRTLLTLEASNDPEIEDEEESTSQSPECELVEDLSCKICGDDEGIAADTICPSCDTRYHESCLHSTASEVGESDTWQQCIECRTLVAYIDKQRRPYSAQMNHMPHAPSRFRLISAETNEISIARIRESKTKIQNHVRNQLKEYYNSSNAIQITKDEFLAINRTVSRSLYAISNNEYKQNIDYDTHAKRAISTELHKMGHTVT